MRKVLEVLGDLYFISFMGKEEYRVGDIKMIECQEFDKDNYTVEQEKWKPSRNTRYWTVDLGSESHIEDYVWLDNNYDEKLLALNLVFKTEEEALARYSEIINLIK